MKKYFFLFLFFTSFIYAKINIIVSIVPQYSFVKAIGGDKINLALMINPGNSPHTYEPKASQMKEISKANIYFSIGVEFEKAWLPRFSNQNQKMQIFDLSYGVKKMHNNGDDPHIWTAPSNIKIIANNIYAHLSLLDKKNLNYYKKNLDTFLSKINTTDKQIKDILKKVDSNSNFMVFHPSWGYFAKEYNLNQIAIEIDGKNPKPKNLSHIIKEARELKIKAIFVQPEFSDKTAQTIANQLQIKVIKISPLAANWSNNLIKLATAIAYNK